LDEFREGDNALFVGDKKLESDYRQAPSRTTGLGAARTPFALLTPGTQRRISSGQVSKDTWPFSF